MQIILLIIAMVFGSYSAQAADLTCNLNWSLLGKKELNEKFSIAPAGGKKVVKLNDTTTATLTTAKGSAQIVVKETGKDKNKSYSVYDFTCDTGLNCTGSRELGYSGTKNNDKITFSPSGYGTNGLIGQRTVASYGPAKNNGFEIRYIPYHAEDGKAMGLWVTCHE